MKCIINIVAVTGEHAEGIMHTSMQKADQNVAGIIRKHTMRATRSTNDREKRARVDEL